MNKKKKNFLISALLLLAAIVFTILVKVVDVRPVGANNSNIGFAGINQFFHKTTGTNMMLYHITEWLGIIPAVMVGSYAIIGLIQLIKRKSLFKVDKEIILLGSYYVVLIAIYIFFEKVIINYRPILVDGVLEASYPSSHTLMSIGICGSFILINKQLFDNKTTKLINILSGIVLLAITLGRLISGVHWVTDIIGGILISSCSLMFFYSFLKMLKKED